MNVKIIPQRLSEYKPINAIDEQNALKEITQEIALSGLSRAGFFKVAAFQGGTCLRILYGLNRFSEDLDFALIHPDQSFEWGPYLKSLQTELEAYGYQVQINDRSSLTKSVKVGFLKDNSIGKLLKLNHQRGGTQDTIRIKLEIDTNPPQGATLEQKYVDFPLSVPVLAYDMPSLFAGKSHELLCREWAKGRDWYDFIWYVSRKTPINFTLLTHAIDQMGPWKGQRLRVEKDWYLEQLRQKISATDWKKQREDVERFLKLQDLDLLNLWDAEFFMGRVDALERYLHVNEK